ncbi:response regulator [Achromobacter seleniivolatilans]|uniref:histidine kinase n=1 Tax=Achromobacter seleniivolatilans TaxID=3047478 RepID=A0ABY9M1G0_9BURK|nr:ATP-binding protein [Achromobacter sp. R39]WMD20795.1 response regulator [Achromobacter sp. R39]
MDPASLLHSFRPASPTLRLRMGQAAALCAIPTYVMAANYLADFSAPLADVWVGLASLICGTGFVAALVALFLLGRKSRQHWRSEERLKDLLAFQTGVLDAIPQPIALRDKDLNLLACNSAFERLFNQSRDALKNTSVTRAVQMLVCDVEAAQIEEDYRQVMLTGLPISKDREFNVGGQAMTVQHWMEPLRNARGIVVGVVGGWMDITQRQRVLKELAIARDRAESANRTKTTFLASVSHEIRTPMNAIMGMLELTLSHPQLPEQDRLQLSTANSASKSLLALIDDLLDLSKMEAGKFQLLPRATNVCELAEEVVDVFHPIAEGKGLGLTLTIDLPEDSSRMHYADPLRLKQIMNNFVSNAIRFTERGGVRVHVLAEPRDGDRQWISLKVSDTGVGIPANALGTLLQPFVQVEETLPALDRGTGLGLSICDRLVKKMGGTIQIESVLGVGTTMTARISLPVAVAPPEPVCNAEPAEPAVPSGVGLHVLVVDDQATNVLLLQRQLEKLGHQVSCARNGLEALALVDQHKFDVVVCDCAMPVMDGYTFARMMRQRKDGSAVLPILGYTAGAHEAEIERARAAGMDQILIKPVNLGSLNRAIGGAMRLKAMALSG